MAGVPGWAGEDEAPFWEGVERGEIRIQHCLRCDRRRFPPRPFCPWCQSPDSAWQRTSGRGTLWSYAIAHPPLVPPFAEIAPYNVIVVALEEDPQIRMVGNLVAQTQGPINQMKPDQIRIGARVRAVFSEGPGGLRLPRWIYY
jgi:uncharacterized OB-fold protein